MIRLISGLQIMRLRNSRDTLWDSKIRKKKKMMILIIFINSIIIIMKNEGKH